MKKTLGLLHLFLMMACTLMGQDQVSLVDTMFARLAGYPAESIYLHCNTYLARPRDTVRWTAYVFQGLRLTSPSTNLYAELYSPSGQLVNEALFPIDAGVATGQVVFPDSLENGTYWIRVYTRYQLNFEGEPLCNVPVTALTNEEVSRVPAKVLLEWGNAPIVSGGKGLWWVASVSDSGLSCHIQADSTVGYFNQPLDLVLTSYRVPLGRVRVNISAAKPWADVRFQGPNLEGPCELLVFCGDSLLGQTKVTLGPVGGPMIQVGQDSFSIAPDGYNVWTVHIPDGVRYNCSVSVTDGDASIDQPEQITQRAPDAWDYGRSLTGYYPELRYWDTSYLTWQGEVQTDKGKPVRGGELILFSADDSSGTPHAALLPIGEDGRVQLTRGYFFDTIRVSYQLNTFQDDPAAKKVQLALDAFLSPRFTLPERFRWKDTSVVVAGARRLFQDSTEAVIKELPAVTVEADRLDFLERQYARGLFTEPTQYRIDLRDTVVYNLWMCLRKHLEGFQGGTDIGETPSFNGHQTIFFVDGVRKSVDQVDSYWYEEMAYAKAYNSFSADASAFTSWVDGGDTIHMAPAPSVLRVPDYNDLAAICIFTRKGKDIRSSHHGLHQVSIPGYTRVAPWSPFSHGLSTLYWNPSVSGGDFVVRFRNRGAASYRLCVEGVARDGRVIHYEKILCGGPDAVKRQILRHRTPKKYLGNL